MMELLIILSFPLGFATGYFWPLRHDSKRRFNKIATDSIFGRLTRAYRNNQALDLSGAPDDVRHFTYGIGVGLEKALDITRDVQHEVTTFMDGDDG